MVAFALLQLNDYFAQIILFVIFYLSPQLWKLLRFLLGNYFMNITELLTIDLKSLVTNCFFLLKRLHKSLLEWFYLTLYVNLQKILDL